MRDLNGEHTSLRLALPSKGELEKPTLEFLSATGLKVLRPNARQYTASIPSVPQISVIFQRAPDIFRKVEEGSVDIGITGYDIVKEKGIGSDNTIAIYNGLGYGACRLVLAVPESWIDVSSIGDFVDLSVRFKEQGRDIRIATKYPNVTKEWLYERGVIHFAIVESQGALEAAPNMGYADLIVDVTSTGTTLRENRLKMIPGGTLLRSEACLIANQNLLENDERKLKVIESIVDLIEAHFRAKKHVCVTSNILGKSQQDVACKLLSKPDLVGLKGPTVSEVLTESRMSEESWFSVTITIPDGKLLDTIDHLRESNGTDITVSSPMYLFDRESWDYRRFVASMHRKSK